ncbi:MAG: YfcE family phosphodiesterase [Anaerolineales bacterium]|nr:YfcE family phosphodiesterase [Anaerolineales bacterium]
MLIAVLSDTHDNRGTIRKALVVARARGAAEILHCGDLTSASVLSEFRGWTVHYAFGNMDRDAAEIRAAADRLDPGSACGAELHLEREGVRIALMHGNHAGMLTQAVRSGAYDFVFHGHTHRRRDERIGRTRAVNPGALGGAASEGYSFCLLDTAGGDVEFIGL